jgi:hypothetical protein
MPTGWLLSRSGPIEYDFEYAVSPIPAYRVRTSTYFFTLRLRVRPEHTADMHNTLRDCALPRTGARTHDIVGCPWDPTISAREYDIVLHRLRYRVCVRYRARPTILVIANRKPNYEIADSHDNYRDPPVNIAQTDEW